MNPNLFAALTARLEALKTDIAVKAEAIKAQYKSRVDGMFADIDADATPVTYGIRAHGDSFIDLIDGAVHAIAELEKQLPKKEDKAA
jgi:hypothetical protein